MLRPERLGPGRRLSSPPILPTRSSGHCQAPGELGRRSWPNQPRWLEPIAPGRPQRIPRRCRLPPVALQGAVNGKKSHKKTPAQKISPSLFHESLWFVFRFVLYANYNFPPFFVHFFVENKETIKKKDSYWKNALLRLGGNLLWWITAAGAEADDYDDFPSLSPLFFHQSPDAWPASSSTCPLYKRNSFGPLT